jgi:hypothetical protein
MGSLLWASSSCSFVEGPAARLAHPSRCAAAPSSSIADPPQRVHLVECLLLITAVTICPAAAMLLQQRLLLTVTTCCCQLLLKLCFISHLACCRCLGWCLAGQLGPSLEGWH